MNTWFTSDPHFFHRNSIALCGRPFASQEAMHDEMIRRWHERVQDGDRVFILGDFSFSRSQKNLSEILRRLRGDKKIIISLVPGNHDDDPKKMLKAGFDEVTDIECSYLLYGRKVTLCHYPFKPSKWEQFKHRAANFWKFWRRKKYHALRYMERRPENDGRWLLHGHTHSKLRIQGRQIHVGVDAWDFYPVNQKTIAAMIAAEESKCR